MRVLVLGGAGYIGERLVNELRERGVDTVSTDIRMAANVDEIVDMRSAGDVYRAFLRHRPEVVIVTAYMLTRPTALNPLRAVETNVLGLTNVFQAAVDLGLRRVVFTASGSIYGHRDDFPEQPVTEEVLCRPRTLYGRMKRFNEWIAEQYNQMAGSGTQIVSFRLSGPHGGAGPHGASRNTGGASLGGSSPYDLVVGAAGRQRRLTLPWSRDSVIRFIHVEDAAAACIPLLIASDLKYRVYNAPGYAITMSDFAATAESICKLDFDWAEPGQTIDYVARIDSTRYEHEFEFRPGSLANWMAHDVARGLNAPATPC